MDGDQHMSGIDIIRLNSSFITKGFRKMFGCLLTGSYLTFLSLNKNKLSISAYRPYYY